MTTVKQFDPQKTPAIEVSQAAIEHIQHKISKTPGAISLRFSVKQAGCSGYKYITDLITETNPTDITCKVTDSLMLYIAKDSFTYLNGIHVDYVEKDLGLKRLVFINPNEKGQCGCGESFHV